MANYYRVAYKESQNTLKQICELFRVDSSDITIKSRDYFADESIYGAEEWNLPYLEK